MDIRTAISIVERSEITSSEPFKRWFHHSKVVDGRGEPLVVYHGSFNSFSAFYPGTHFGDIEAANSRIEYRLADNDHRFSGNSGTIYPVYLSIQNPLRIEDDYGLSDGYDLAVASHKAGAIDERELALIRNETYATTARRELFKLLSQRGYDGLVYKNVVEGSADSWIPFRSEQVKSVFNSGRFSASNSDFMESWDEDDVNNDWTPEEFTLPAGTILYHGTNVEFDPSNIYTPAWFSRSKAVAQHFSKWRPGDSDPRIHTFRVEEPITLWEIISRSDFDNFIERYGVDGEDVEQVGDQLLSLGLDGWIIPHNYPNGDDILLVDTNALSYIDTISPNESTQLQVMSEGSFDDFYKELPGKGNWAPYIVRKISNADRSVYKVFHQGHLVASAVMSATGEYITDLMVLPEHRRRGIATELYNFIETDIGAKLKPSPLHRTEAGEAFWRSRSH